MITLAPSTANDDPQGAPQDDPELTVDQVAERLGLPVDMLIRRIEAGDVPARRVADGEEVRYLLRFHDMGPNSEMWSTPTAEVLGVLQQTSVDEGCALSDALESADAPAIAVAADDIEFAEANAAPAGEDAIAISGPLIERYEALRDIAVDGHELLASLLDRWERGIERRIYAEQSQRFEVEIRTRQWRVQSLELELRAARAEHAMILADKERIIAEQARQLSDQEVDARRRGRNRNRFIRLIGR